MNQEVDSESNRWNKSRSGAWAGRGFHYQHIVATLILVRQWSGLAATGALVPEGLEDCVIELADKVIWIQIKSREAGTFSQAEVKNIFAEVKHKASLVKQKKVRRLVVVLEQPGKGVVGRDMETLFDKKSEMVVICQEPEENIMALLTSHLNTAEVIAAGIASDLYQYVAKTSAENAAVSFEDRKRISTTEIERRIYMRLEAEDPSAIEQALVSKIVEPVDFFTATNEPGFYQGVKVYPGHIVAGLVLKRPQETADIVCNLKRCRHLLITGPSGAGKSGLMWLVAHTLAAEFRWFEVKTKASVADVDSIVRFIQSRQPKANSPLGIVLDDVGGANSAVWDILVRELRGLADVYLLGSIRKEDQNLIANQSDTIFQHIKLDENLASDIWRQLQQRGQTHWGHWCEPFEQSNGLMLEYVHLLTKGEHLSALIADQIRQRENEERYDELAIIRITSAISEYGGEIEVKKLFTLLQLSPEKASKALKRLLDEHLVHEKSAGLFGGMHSLRSKALRKATHDDIVFESEESVWRGMSITTNETIPRIIQALLDGVEVESEKQIIKRLAETLGDNNEINFWVALLTGLGIATVERYVAALITILKQAGVQPAQWPVVGMFVVSGVEFPKFNHLEHWMVMEQTILDFRALTRNDLRSECLEMLPAETVLPNVKGLEQANQWLLCIAPIMDSYPIDITHNSSFINVDEFNIADLISLLSTAYLFGTEFAQHLVTELGGEEALLSIFTSQTPWLENPVIITDGRHGCTVRANWYYVAENYQLDADESIRNVCEGLITLSPRFDAVASDAVGPDGESVQFGEFSLYSKNMPRENVPVKAKIAWNVAFKNTLLAKTGESNLTDYTHKMGELVRRTVKLFRNFSEQWIRTKIANKDKLASDATDILTQVNGLAYASPVSVGVVVGDEKSADVNSDNVGALLSGVISNLMRRMGDLVSAAENKSTATFAGDLASQAQVHAQSSIWRTNLSPPVQELVALAERLQNVSSILHELNDDASLLALIVCGKLNKVAKQASIGKAVASAARYCRALADKRLQNKLARIERAIKSLGGRAKCWTRPISDRDSIYWPPLEVAILVGIDELEKELCFMDESYIEGKNVLEDDYRFRVVPVFNGKVVAELAVLPSTTINCLPDLKFADEWQSHINMPFLASKTIAIFERAVSDSVAISSIINCRNMNDLHVQEDDALSQAIDSFKCNQALIEQAAEKTDLDDFYCALGYLNNAWEKIIEEYDAIKAGTTVDNPLCRGRYSLLAGESNGELNELGFTKIFLCMAVSGLQSEESIYHTVD